MFKPNEAKVVIFFKRGSGLSVTPWVKVFNNQDEYEKYVKMYGNLYVYGGVLEGFKSIEEASIYEAYLLGMHCLPTGFDLTDEQIEHCAERQMAEEKTVYFKR